MKEYLELKRQALPNYAAEGLLQRIRKSAKEHGYRSAIVFGWVRFKDHWLQQIAMRASWNGMRIRCQRQRGVSIGQKVHWGTNVFIDPLYPYFVQIEDGAAFAGCDVVLTHTKSDQYHSRFIDSYVAPVIIRKNAWVAVNVTILPGVEIGEGAIVSAGSVVSKDVPPMTIVSGNPAVVVADMAPLVKKNYSKEEYGAIIAARKEKFGI